MDGDCTDGQCCATVPSADLFCTSCTDGVKNANELAIDRGGADCGGCGVDQYVSRFCRHARVNKDHCSGTHPAGLPAASIPVPASLRAKYPGLVPAGVTCAPP